MTEVCPCCPPMQQNSNSLNQEPPLPYMKNGMIPTSWTMIYRQEDLNPNLKIITFSNLPVLYHTYLVMQCPLLLFLVVLLEKTMKVDQDASLLDLDAPNCDDDVFGFF
jgi:hypothetical protein